jgi:hypothetical protein
VTVALSVVDAPLKIEASVPAFTTGRAFTVTVVANEATLWHPDAFVTCTV